MRKNVATKLEGGGGGGGIEAGHKKKNFCGFPKEM